MTPKGWEAWRKSHRTARETGRQAAEETWRDVPALRPSYWEGARDAIARRLQGQHGASARWAQSAATASRERWNELRAEQRALESDRDLLARLERCAWRNQTTPDQRRRIASILDEVTF